VGHGWHVEQSIETIKALKASNASKSSKAKQVIVGVIEACDSRNAYSSGHRDMCNENKKGQMSVSGMETRKRNIATKYNVLYVDTYVQALSATRQRTIYWSCASAYAISDCNTIPENWKRNICRGTSLRLGVFAC
jgi:hypothetical protein